MDNLEKKINDIFEIISRSNNLLLSIKERLERGLGGSSLDLRVEVLGVVDDIKRHLEGVLGKFDLMLKG